MAMQTAKKERPLRAGRPEEVFLFFFCSAGRPRAGCRRNSTPSVPGPQWEDTVQPAWVTNTSLKGASCRTSSVSWRRMSSGTSPEWVIKAWSGITVLPVSRSVMY